MIHDSIFSINVLNNTDTERMHTEVVLLAPAFESSLQRQTLWAIVPAPFQEFIGYIRTDICNRTLTHVWKYCFVYHKWHPRVCIVFCSAFFHLVTWLSRILFSLENTFIYPVVFKSCIIWNCCTLINHLTTHWWSFLFFSVFFFPMTNKSLYFVLFV